MRIFIALVALATVAHAEPLERLPEGAPVYASLRPLAMMGLLKRMGVGELPEVKQLSKQLGGLDLLNPALLAPTGLDVATPIVAYLEVLPGRRGHLRVLATLRDPSLFGAFLAGMAASNQVPITTVAPASPLGKLGVFATAQAPNHGVAVARLDDKLAVIDYVEPADEKSKPMTAQELVKRLPLTTGKPFAVERGARQLFTPDAALVIYADGHKLPGMVQALSDKAAGKNEALCLKQWSAVPGAFDDVALSLGVDPDGLSASLAWGSRSGAPLGGLKLVPVDDGAFDVAVLKSAPAVLALYAATLTPFSSLKRSGPLASSTALTDSFTRCGIAAGTTLFVRSWPQAIGSLLSGGVKGNPMQAGLVNAFGSLRTIVLVLRELSISGAGQGATQKAKWAVGATLDPQAKSMLDLFLGASSGGAAPTALKVGKRQPMVYHLDLDGNAASAGVETLASGKVSLLVADSDESVAWSLRTATPMPGKALPPPDPVPIAAAFLDGAQLVRMLPALRLGASDEKTLTQALARLRRIDARLTADGDLFRLTVRAPVKQ